MAVIDDTYLQSVLDKITELRDIIGTKVGELRTDTNTLNPTKITEFLHKAEVIRRAETSVIESLSFLYEQVDRQVVVSGAQNRPPVAVDPVAFGIFRNENIP